MNNTFLNVPEAYQGRLIEVVGADMAPPDRAVLYSTIQAIQPTSQAPTDLRARLETTCVSSRCGQLFGSRRLLISPGERVNRGRMRLLGHLPNMKSVF
jgi:hypothetical protein